METRSLLCQSREIRAFLVRYLHNRGGGDCFPQTMKQVPQLHPQENFFYSTLTLRKFWFLVSMGQIVLEISATKEECGVFALFCNLAFGFFLFFEFRIFVISGIWQISLKNQFQCLRPRIFPGRLSRHPKFSQYFKNMFNIFPSVFAVINCSQLDLFPLRYVSSKWQTSSFWELCIFSNCTHANSDQYAPREGLKLRNARHPKFTPPQRTVENLAKIKTQISWKNGAATSVRWWAALPGGSKPPPATPGIHAPPRPNTATLFGPPPTREWAGGFRLPKPPGVSMASNIFQGFSARKWPLRLDGGKGGGSKKRWWVDLDPRKGM